MQTLSILLLALAGACFGADEKQIPQWTRFEVDFTSSGQYENPAQEVRFTAEFTGPAGTKSAAPGFWDGGKTWRVRFSPNQTGHWTYRTSSSDPGLDGRTGGFTCVAYRGSNHLYQHGAIRVSGNRRHFEHDDGVAFLWLGDTVWSGPMRSEPADWEFYLRDRESKKFSVIQFVSTNWKVDPTDAAGKTAFTGKERIAIQPEFYQRLDERVDAINAHGMIAALVLLWASPNTADQNPGAFLPEDQAALLARYQLARYGAHQAVWILNGDGDYSGEKAERWKRIGRAVFTGQHPGRLATLHAQGMRWMPDFFAAEPWFDFNGYQTGHRDDEPRLRWLAEGPPSKTWKTESRRPDVNLEPNYEGHNSRSPGASHVFDARDARRAAYWSLLVSPPAGVTYGAHGIWSWEKTAVEPRAHRGTGIAPPWRDALRLEGSTGMKHMMELFGSLAWWKLLPAQGSLVEQPGREDARKFVAVGEAEDGTFSIAYLPEGGVVELRSDKAGRSRWYDPRTGKWSAAQRFDDGASKFTAPGPGDWVLCREFTRAAALGQGAHPHHSLPADEYAKMLEDPARDVWQKPGEVVMALDLKTGQGIADIGAGSGYFARRFAPHVDTVYAVDIDEKLLAIARNKAPANVKTILAMPDDPRLPKSSVDTVFFCDVLHHIENRPAYYAKLAEALKPGGRIVVIDFYPKPLPVGPPPAMKLSDEQVIGEFKKAGFTLSKRLDTLPYQYFLFFEKRR